jgi:hypothetical protein
MNHADKGKMAVALMAAIEPLVDTLLEIGVTSPEAESLLRSVFVHRAKAWLTNQYPKDSLPSGARIALVSGVHRNFVRSILAERPKIAPARRRKHSRADRLLRAWHSDPRYLDGSGKPRDLPEKGRRPSFQSLANAYLPELAPGVVLAELKRAKSVQLLAAGRVRVRSKVFRVGGINLSSLIEFGNRAGALIATLGHNLHHPEALLFVDSTRFVQVEAHRVAAVREVIGRRAATFLARMEHELTATQSATTARTSRKTKVALTMFATEQ